MLTGIVYLAELLTLGGRWDEVSGLASVLPFGLMAGWMILWVCVGAAPDTGQADNDGRFSKPIRQTKAQKKKNLTSAFGVTLTAGFVLAAGLRGAGSTGLTAIAIAACLGVLVGGVATLFILPISRQVPEVRRSPRQA